MGASIAHPFEPCLRAGAPPIQCPASAHIISSPQVAPRVCLLPWITQRVVMTVPTQSRADRESLNRRAATESAASWWQTSGWLQSSRFASAVLGLAIVTHLYGLGSLHIMGNGDEMIYAQITRVTAASGHWLPLMSDMPDMRNTKPPLLFWQGILSTDWGQTWTLVALRWPSVAWTLLTAWLVGLLAWRATERCAAAGMFAAALYLAFFSTYRYGRPFLTNPPETFWVFLCFFSLLWWRPRSFSSRVLFPVLLGVIAGLALLTKSFAQLLPIGIGLTVWHLRACNGRWKTFFVRSVPGLAGTALLSLGIFSIWFLSDPDPQSIWNEFVINENLGKMAAGQPSYLGALLWGRTSIWGLALGWFLNAGLLAFPLAGTMIRAWQHRQTATEEEKLLWLWALVIFLVFCLPTQRSGRYLLEAMPAIAVLMALQWHRLLPMAYQTTLIGSGAVALLVAWLSFLLLRQAGGNFLPWWHWGIVLGALAVPLLGLCDRRRLVACTVPAALAALLSVASFLTAFDAPQGIYSAETIAAAANRVVWVPQTFRAAAEIEHLLLPGAIIRGLAVGQQQPTADAVGQAVGQEDLVVVIRSLRDPPPAAALGSRIELASRHTARQIIQMASGHLEEHLFCREWLLPVATLHASD